MQVCYIIFGRGAALNEVEAGTFVHNDQRMLKLACTLGVQAEVALQRNLHLHSLGYIHKGSARPHRTVKGGELVIPRGDQLHEVLLHHVGVLPVECAFHVGVYHTLCGNLFPHVVIHQLRVVLGTYACQTLPLCFRDAQALEGILNVLGDVFPVVLHLGVGAHIGSNVRHVQPFDAGTPVGDLHFIINL